MSDTPYSRALARVERDASVLLRALEGRDQDLGKRDMRKIRQVVDAIAPSEGWGLRRRVRFTGGYRVVQISIWRPGRFGHWCEVPAFCDALRMVMILQTMAIRAGVVTLDGSETVWGDSQVVLEPVT